MTMPDLNISQETEAIPYVPETDVYISPSKRLGAVAVEQVTRGADDQNDLEPPPGRKWYNPR